MKCFTMAEFQHRRSEIVDMALKEPVGLTRYGKRKFVLVSQDFHDEIMDRKAPQRAFHTDDVPEDLMPILLEGLSGLPEEDSTDD